MDAVTNTPIIFGLIEWLTTNESLNLRSFHSDAKRKASLRNEEASEFSKH
jgi:hypothetical protein